LVEVVAFVSVLSVTFWLGMFLLAGIAFVMLPVKFPQEYQDHLFYSPALYGYIFLGCVAAYLVATVFVRKPLRIGGQYFAFPPFRLSVLQLTVSAIDFALASLVLYVLLPPGTANYSTVLVSYLSAMIVTVVLHVPGGFGVLELIVIELLRKEGSDENVVPLAVTCGLLLFRVIYHFIPGILATLLFLREEYETYRERKSPIKDSGQA
jgi:glycosyltransferase 2 family protein